MKLPGRVLANLAGIVLCLLVGDANAQVRPDPVAKIPAPRGNKAKPVYTVSKYDPERKAAEDLAAAIKRAKAERKRIILEVGGTW